MRKFVNLEQGTEEWLKFRNEKIGASEAATILGWNPWESENELIERKKTGASTFVPNVDTKRGTELEPVVRKMINEKYSADYQPVVMENSELDFAVASLDGWDENAEIKVLEIKCPRKHPFSVPRYHEAQLQWQLMVSEENEALYVTFDGIDIKEWIVKRDARVIELLKNLGGKTREKFSRT